jgi:hypothetical protein
VIARAMRQLAALGLVLALFAAPTAARAHDVPSESIINTFVQVDDERVDLVVRLPLVLLLSMDLPQRGPGYLDLANIEEHLAEAARVTAEAIVILENGRPLVPERSRARISQPADRSFESYADAVASIEGPPLPATENVFWNQGHLDVRLTYPITSAESDLVLRLDLAPGLARLTRFLVRYETASGVMRAYDVHGTTRELTLDPGLWQAAHTFLEQGVRHILEGVDHLLFLLCLVLPLRERLWRLIGVVTAFTLGHSVTLIAAAQGLAPDAAWFSPLVETLIAASILYMAIENVLGASFERRWFLAAGFGLVHGFGFASQLTDVLQLAGPHLVTSLLFFNLGIEIGQVAVLLLVVPLLRLLMREARRARYTLLLVSAFAGHEAWHWLVERAGDIDPATLPGPDAALVFQAVVWLATLAFVLVLVWLVVGALGERRRGIRSGP